MLPQIILDDEDFSGITEKSVRQIPVLSREWTNFNTHDPGITMLELFAWLKEMQQFHLNRTGDAHMHKYLKLLGYQQEDRKPAEAEIFLEGIMDQVFFPKNSRFYAGDICFETTEERIFDAVRVVRLVSAARNEKRTCPAGGKKLHFAAFGTYQKKGDCFMIGLDAPLTPGVEQKLCLRFFQDVHRRRNPILDKKFFPFAEYVLSYLGKKGFQKIRIRKDTTHQMIEDGYLAFSIEKEMALGEDGLYWLKLSLVKSDYDAPPVIEKISFSQIEARQTATVAECHTVNLGKEKKITIKTRLAYQGKCMLFVQRESGFCKYEGGIYKEKEKEGITFYFPDLSVKEKDFTCSLILTETAYEENFVLGEGNGMPYQEYETGIPNLCREGLIVLAENKAGSGCYQFWELRHDFDSSYPSDLHYCFDEETGILSFGDCMHGMAPEGKILLAAAHTSLGTGGNVKAGRICGAEAGSDLFGITVKNDKEAAGGADHESLKQCRRRMLLEQNQRMRAVTYEDFESLTMQTPGLLIESVRVIPITECERDKEMEQETVSIVVKPYSKEIRPVLSETYKKNILYTLEAKRMVGTKIKILSPEYISITVFAEVKTAADSIAVKKEIDRLLRDFFGRIRADFGCCIQYGAIYGMIDVLDCVAGLGFLNIDAHGNNIRRSRNGDIFLPPNGLAWFKEFHCSIVME